MVYVALGFLGVAALSGLAIALVRMSYKPVSKTTGFVHGSFGLIGFVLILVQGILDGFTRQTLMFTGLFSVVVLLGGVMFTKRLSNQEISLTVVLLHGTLAVAAISVLMFSTFKFLQN